MNIELSPTDFYNYIMNVCIQKYYYVNSKNEVYGLSNQEYIKKQFSINRYFLPCGKLFNITDNKIYRDELIDTLLPLVRREKINKIKNRILNEN